MTLSSLLNGLGFDGLSSLADANQTGQMLLGWPQAAFTSKVAQVDDRTMVTRQIDGSLETPELELPTVITTDRRLSMRNVGDSRVSSRHCRRQERGALRGSNAGWRRSPTLQQLTKTLAEDLLCRSVSP